MREKMAAAFNEWMKRYTQNPEQFEREWQVVNEFLAEHKEGIPPTYGEQCATYLEELMSGREATVSAPPPKPTPD